MTKFLPSLLLLLATATCRLCLASDLPGDWKLEVHDRKSELRVIATVQFSDHPAPSCMSGTWKVVVVKSISMRSAEFFPIEAPLAYSIQNGTLTLGRTEICDGYLFLSGNLDRDKIQGGYSSVFIGGGNELGRFTLKRTL